MIRDLQYKINKRVFLAGILGAIFLCISGYDDAKAQDPHFSQFYAAPLYLNPAFAGSTEQSRIGLNFRDQWPSLAASFITASVFFDHYFVDYNSGVGVMINGDREGLAGLYSTSFALQYSYQLRLTDDLTFRAGLQGAYFNRSLNFDKLVFSDQIDPNTGEVGGSSAETFNTGLSKSFADISMGGVFYGRNFYIGYAAHHVNQPNQSLTGDAPSRLNIRNSVHGGYKFLLPTSLQQKSFGQNKGFTREGKERSITTAAQYKAQGRFDQLDVGLYLNYEPLVVGFWYRGLPIEKDVEGNTNNESAIMLVGFTSQDLNIGYSFDYTLSGLGIASGGAHEVSVTYKFSLRDPSIPPKNVRKIPCPKF